MLTLRLASALLFIALATAVGLSRSVDAEPSRVPNTPAATPTPGWQEAPDVASNGRDFLVVWEDHGGDHAKVYGTRVTATGKVLDPGGISIATAPFNHLEPAVAWDGSRYVVVWTEDRGSDSMDVLGARVTAKGKVLDRPPIAVSAGPRNESGAVLDRIGKNTLIVWQDARGDELKLWGTRLNRKGRLLEPNGFQVMTRATYGDPAVSCTARVCLVTSGANDVWGARVTAAGRALDASGFPITSGGNVENHGAVASSGSRWFAVWQQIGHFETSWEVGGAVVAPNGRVARRRPLATGIWTRYQPDVTWTGGHHLVVYTVSEWEYDIWAKRVTHRGRVLDRKPVRIHSGYSRQEAPAVASNGRLSLVVWQGLGSSADIFGARVTRAGRVIDRKDPHWGDRFLISVGK